jgi:hypothetical protein
MSLVFCVGVVPVELSFWDDLDFCEPLPTLEPNMATDVVFLVAKPKISDRCACNLYLIVIPSFLVFWRFLCTLPAVSSAYMTLVMGTYVLTSRHSL